MNSGEGLCCILIFCQLFLLIFQNLPFFYFRLGSEVKKNTLDSNKLISLTSIPKLSTENFSYFSSSFSLSGVIFVGGVSEGSYFSSISPVFSFFWGVKIP